MVKEYRQLVAESELTSLILHTAVHDSFAIKLFAFYLIELPFRIQVCDRRLSNNSTEHSGHARIFATCFITVLIVRALMHVVPFTFLCIVVITVPMACFEECQ